MKKNIVQRLVDRLAYELRRENYGPKIFCIGYLKTGTTSVGLGLKELGFRHSSFDKKVWVQLYQKDKIIDVIKYTSKFDSFDDLPWLKEDMIPVLDKVFPGSRFIYLEREETPWVESFQRWRYLNFGAWPNVGEEMTKFRKHTEFVREYFRGREGKDFMTLSVSAPDGFEKMAFFLGKEPLRKGFSIHVATTGLNLSIPEEELWTEND